MTHDETARFAADFWRSEEPYALSDGAPLEKAERGHLLVKTSGSEGRAKWVALHRDAMLASAEAVNQHLHASNDDRWLIALPISHVGGFAIYARAFVSGSQVHRLNGKWDAQHFADACATQRITLTSLVPTQVFDLVQAKLPAPPSLRAIVVGAGSMSDDLAQQARSLGWPVLQSYGMTEACSQIATQPLDQGHGMIVLPHWQTSCAPDGTLLIAGPSLASGYFVHDQHDAWQWQPITSPFATRDYVSITTEGDHRSLRYLGREAHTLKIMGELVHLAPLQAYLDEIATKLGINARCIIVPIADERRESILVLAHEGTFDADLLLRAFNAGVEPWQRITRSIGVAHLPITAMGKVQFDELRQLIES